jgi:predicted TIM-barrel fold metal-dependent hydrolase
VTLIYSCDSHVVEPAALFAGLADRFGERAPVVVHEWKGQPGTFLAWPKHGFAQPIGRLGIAGHRLDQPETQQMIQQGWEGLNPGMRDPAARLKEQDVDGVAGEVLYPSINMFTFGMPDHEIVQIIFQRHNDWLRDFCSAAPERLIAVALIPLPEIEASIAELQRAAKAGMRAIGIACTAPAGKPYSDPLYEPFWSAAEEIGLPVSMHIFCGGELGMGLPRDWDPIVAYTLAHAAIWNTVSTLITSGVPERHPGLRFICAEWETGWLAHVLKRFDHATYRSRQSASADLKLQPSDYFRRQFYATFEDDNIGVETRHDIGVERLMWGNDYPHHDSVWPHSQQILAEVMAGVPDDERDAMVWRNVQQLYSIDAARLPLAVAQA